MRDVCRELGTNPRVGFASSVAVFGGLVPDVYQQFTKRQGVFSHPPSPKSPVKLRLAFEAAPLPAFVILPSSSFFSGFEAADLGARSFLSFCGFSFLAGGSPVKNSG